MLIVINGVDVTTYYFPKTLSIEDAINERSTASFKMTDETGQLDLKDGQPIDIYDNDNVHIFGGFLFFPKRFVPVATNAVFYDVEATDQHLIADRFIVAETFTNETTGDIAKTLRTNYLAADGITIGEIQDGPNIEAITFTRIGTVSDAMDELAELSGFSWWISHDKQLYFVERSTFRAPFDLTDESPIWNVNLREDKSRYRNTQYIRGGLDRTQEIAKEKPTPSPDGVSKTFVTRFPIAKKPRIFIDSVEVLSADIGVNGFDTGKKYYYTYNSNNITQDNSETILNTEVLEITYVGLYPLLVVAQDAQAVEDRKAIEGGTGIYENISNEPKINQRENALEIANGKLRKYTKIEREMTYQTISKGLLAGQIQNVNMDKYKVENGQFLIDRITITDFEGKGTMLYDVHMVDGEAFGGWTQFFKQLAKEPGKLIIREDEVLVILQTIFESQGWGEDTTPTAFACPIPSETLYPSEILKPC